MLRNAVLVALNAALICPMVAGQASSPSSAPSSNPSDRPPTIRTTTHEVLVDLVVRDKHHHLITNLRPDEVVVTEDGVPQKINAFRGIAGAEQLESERNLVKNASPGSVAATGSANPGTSLRQFSFVAIVFGDIAPLNFEFAREAVQEFLKSDNLPNTYVSIYRSGRTLSIARLYTDDKELLAKSVDGVAKGLRTDDALGTQATVVAATYSSLQAIADNILSSPLSNQLTQTAVRNAILNPLPTIARDPLFARDAVSQDATITLGNAILAQARIENGIRFATSLANGMNTLDSLREIVHSQETLPGRKVVLYLSDGLDLPMNRRDAVDNLISYANRAGVAFYAVDTRGLNNEDPMMRSLAELQHTAAVSSAQRSDPINGHKEDDDIQITAVGNRQLALRELAESTGGFAVTDTNEIAAPMQRVMEDIRSHYELAYTPVNTLYDGRFRKIEVKILRPHVTVQSRKGYFALPTLNGQSLQPFEAAALNAINSGSTSQQPPYHLAVMKFRPSQNAVEYQVAFEIPTSGLGVIRDPKTGMGSVRTALFAVIRDSSGEVVGKIGHELTREMAASPDLPLSGDDILYAEPVELAPGHYNVDAALADEKSGQISIKRLAFFVPPASDFGLSSLELVREHDVLSGGQHSVDPGQFPKGQILPVLADSVSSGKPMDLYFVLYPAKMGSGEPPKVTLELLHDGKELVRKPLELPHPEADGSIPIRLRFAPMPGQCDIFVVAQQGKLAAQSSLSVKVE